MKSYKISGLDDKTPQPKQDRLKASLAKVAGVEKVELNAKKNQVSVTCGPKLEAKPELIKAAVSSAGFSVADKAKA